MTFQLDKIIKQLNIVILAALVVFLPFATNNNFISPTKTAKFFLFLFVAIIIFSLFLLQIVLKKQDKALKFSVLDLLIAVFFIYLSANMLFNIDRYGVPDRFIEFLGLAALYIVFRGLMLKHFKVLFVAVLLSGFLQAVYGNLQLYGVFLSRHNLFNITGGFFNPGPYAGYLAVVFPVALALYFATTGNKNQTETKGVKIKLFKNSYKPKMVDNDTAFATNGLTRRFINRFNLLSKNAVISERLIIQYVAIVALLTILLVLPSTRSRAAWLAVIVPSCIILANKHKLQKIIKSKLNTMLKKTVFVTIFIFITGLSVLGLYSMKKGSADGRLLIWKVTTKMIGQKPIFGYGYNRFGANYLNSQAAYFSKTGTESEAFVADNSTRAFNEYLQLAAETGIVGLLLLGAIAWFLFFEKTGNMDTGNKPYLLAAKMSLLAFAIFGYFSYPTEILPIKLVVTICLAFIAANQKKISLKKTNAVMQAKAVRPLLFTVSFAALLFTTLLVLPLKEKYEIQKKWKQAYLTYQMGLYENSFQEYAELYGALKYDGAYLVNYGKACSMAAEHKQAVKILKRAENFSPNTLVYTALGDSYKALGKIDKAEQAYKKASFILPARFYPRYLLAKLYDGTGQNQKAIHVATKILNKKIKIQSTAIEEIKTEMKEIIERNE